MSDERLGSTLFIAALVHGVVILGVTFTALPAGDEGVIPSLNVTLVLDTEREELVADTAKRRAVCGRRALCRRTSRPRSSATLWAPTPRTARRATRRRARSSS